MVLNAAVIEEADLFENLPMPCLVLDERACIVAANRQWLQAMEFTEAEVLHKPLEVFLHPNGQARFKEGFVRLSKEGVVEGGRYLLRNKAGLYHEFAMQGEGAFGARGRFHHVICTFQAIPDGEEAGKALSFGEGRFRSFAEDMPFMAVCFSEKLSVLFINKAVQEFFGTTQEQVLGRTLSMFFLSPGTRKSVQRFARSLSQKRPVETLELKHRDHHNRRRLIRWMLRAIFDESGKAIEYHAIGEDITARKGIEQQLIRTRENALLASRAKSDFLASMSHEIRTPLNGIIGMTEYLSSLELPEQHEQCVSLIHQSGNMLLELINDILDFSKIEDGKLILQYDPVDLRREIPYLLGMLKERAGNKSIRIEENIELSHDFFWTDLARLKQVLINLVGNAIKFTPRGGEILVSVKETDNRYLEFKVKDNGVGISEDKIAKLFEPFVQADGMINQKLEGTGLGLSICKRIVETMQGRVFVTSEEGLGSCFSFIIPCEPVEKPESSKEEALVESKKPEGPEWIHGQALIVDDNRQNCLVLKKLLEQLGVEGITVMSAEEALQQLQSTDPRIIFLDLNLPGQSGLELCRQLSQFETRTGGERPYRVAYTASATTTVQKLCYEHGFHDFIAKPVTFDNLLKVLDRHKAFRTKEN